MMIKVERKRRRRRKRRVAVTQITKKKEYNIIS